MGTGDKVASVFELSVCLFVCLFVCLSVLGKFSNLFLQYKAAVLQKNDSRIDAVYSGCLVVRVGGSRLDVGLIKYCDFHRSLLARSISDPSVLATRGAYVFIFSVVCCLYVTFLLPPERATKVLAPTLFHIFSYLDLIKL